MNYDFCRVHGSLRVTPAMEAGVVDELYGTEFILELVEAEAAAKPRSRGSYKKCQI